MPSCLKRVKAKNSFRGVVRGEDHAVSVRYRTAGGGNGGFVYHLLHHLAAVFFVAYYLQKYQSAHETAGKKYTNGEKEYGTRAYGAPRFTENGFWFC